MAVPIERLKIQSVMSARLIENEAWRNLSAGEQATIIRRMERSCCSATIFSCERDGIDRTFGDKRFRERYSASCARVIACLTPTSTLVDGLVSGSIDCCDVAKLTDVELCPEASVTERDMIDRRQNAKYRKKVCRLYRCGKCGENETLPLTYQSRAADEASTISVKCVKCAHVWRM